jgi:RimJ/RimL family protein N-acetyltransferase
MSFLSSPRLVFRTWSESDLPDALSLWTDPEVNRFLGGPMSPETVRERLNLEMDRQRKLGLQYWPVYLRSNGAFAGCAGLRPFHHEAGVYEMGVHIARPYWSMQLGEEAACAVMEYAFGTLGAMALTAGHNPNHLHSKRLIERLGFRFSHTEPWGPLGTETPFYRLHRPQMSLPQGERSR